MNKRICFLFLLSLIGCVQSYSQQTNAAKAGKPAAPVIRDGVYFSFESIEKNQPDLLLKDLFKSYYDSSFTISQWANTQNLYYNDKSGNRQSLNRDSVWGYCDRGTPYICLNKYFHKISTVGMISLFLEFYPLIRDPLSIVRTDSRGTSEERILDFETGKVGSYSIEYFIPILQRDEELNQSFMALKKDKAKRKKMYSYIEKYNEKHPLFDETTRNNN